MPSFVRGYECFYLNWNSKLLEFNYWLLAICVIGVTHVLEDCSLSRTHQTRSLDNLVGAPRAFVADLQESLLGDLDEAAKANTCTVGDIEYEKLATIMNAAAISEAIYVIVDVPFICSHKIIACILFLPILAPLAAISLLGLWIAMHAFISNAFIGC